MVDVGGRPQGDAWAGNSGHLRSAGGSYPMRVGQLSESDAVDVPQAAVL